MSARYDRETREASVDRDDLVRPKALVGIRACDLTGLLCLDRFFLGQEYVDEVYRDHRKKMFVVANTCVRPFPQCFCVCTDSGPAPREGYDAALTAVGDHYLFEAGSGKGEALARAARPEGGRRPTPRPSSRRGGRRLDRPLRRRGHGEQGLDLPGHEPHHHGLHLQRRLGVHRRPVLRVRGLLLRLPDLLLLQHRGRRRGRGPDRPDEVLGLLLLRGLHAHGRRPQSPQARRGPEEQAFLLQAVLLPVQEIPPAGLRRLRPLRPGLPGRHRHVQRRHLHPARDHQGRCEMSVPNPGVDRHRPRDRRHRRGPGGDRGRPHLLLLVRDGRRPPGTSGSSPASSSCARSSGPASSPCPCRSAPRTTGSTCRSARSARSPGPSTSSRPGTRSASAGPSATASRSRPSRARTSSTSPAASGSSRCGSSIVHVLQHRPDFGRIILIYGSRSSKELMYRDMIAAWQATEGFETYFTIDRPEPGWTGPVGFVHTLVGPAQVPVENTVAFVCGPPLMFNSVIKELLAAGLKDEAIVSTLERHMKCGIGKCQHCAIGRTLVCTDGPVYTYKQIKTLGEQI
ncbi:MAG: hypothetical protein M0C28_12725 [Candidatus Moduliflexus flocculans]|nr:hypothetical protein [Candidatus Moduliflexus flocculans]